MSDYFPGEITLGGSIPRRLLDELAGVVVAHGVSLDWQYALDRAAVRAAIETAAAKGETVRFTDDQAAYGQFDELERWLTSHGIGYDRHSDARYEYDAENVYGRGRKRQICVRSDQSGKDLVSAEEVRRLLAGRAPADRKLARLARLVVVPPPLTPIVLMGRKEDPHERHPRRGQAKRAAAITPDQPVGSPQVHPGHNPPDSPAPAADQGVG